jgi:SAM-dependent methyltransferase
VSCFWHPLSTILLTDPPCLASTGVLRMLLRAEGAVRLRYAGDRMWPAMRHGSSFRAAGPSGGAPRPGEVVLASVSGVPDLLRVARREGERLRLRADADPGSPVEARLDDVLAVAELPARAAPIPGTRRLLLDLHEALHGRPDPRGDAAQTVREKYDAQAVHYARSESEALEAGLEARIREQVPAGSAILVVGSGTGRECFALARAGFRVRGVDFSTSMVRTAREEAERRGSDVAFEAADIRRLGPPAEALGAVLFTYNVYSFLPGSSERVAVLSRMRAWLRPEGVVHLSARRLASAYAALILGLQRLALRRGAEWGDSHTRWIGPDGSLHRSYVHVFTDRALRREAARAGYRMERWRGGHAVLRPAPAANIPAPSA